MMILFKKLLILCLCTGICLADEFNPFASRVIDISLNAGEGTSLLPAPGGYINLPDFADSSKAIGSPNGGGTLTANNDVIVTLGGFGGRIVLAFENDVLNDPANFMGLDAIVFGNAMYNYADPHLRWAEPGTIEIMPEIDGDGIPRSCPQEKWYLIPGSDNLDNTTYQSKLWQSDFEAYPKNPEIYSGWPESYETTGFSLYWQYYNDGATRFVVNPYYLDEDDENDNLDGVWGYADCSPTLRLGDRDGDNLTDSVVDFPQMDPKLFYSMPDNPFEVGITKGSCGGDAFDISWAIDPVTSELAGLESFRYIRITTATECDLGQYGEVSTEVDAVADVRPLGDVDGNGCVDLCDLMLITNSWLLVAGDEGFNPGADFNADNKIDMNDYTSFAYGWAVSIK